MTSQVKLHTLPMLPPTRGYCHLAEVIGPGRLIYTSGMLPLDSAGNLIGKGDIRVQAEQTYQNIKVALASVGATFDNVIKTNTYLIDVTQAPLVREVRRRYLNAAAPPASTLVGVAALGLPDLLIEVEVVAVVPA
ncbi:MAG: RidA family protein [Pseudorhodoplanes sp.]